MTHRLLILAATLLSLGAAPVAAVKGRTSVPSGSSVFLDARSSESVAPLAWKQIAGPDAFRFAMDLPGRPGVALMVPAPPDGAYRYAVVAAGEPDAQGVVPLDVDVIDVTVGAQPAPAPTPAPSPVAPDVPPPGGSGKLWVTYVVGATPTAPAAALRTAPTLRAALAGLNADWRTFVKDQPELSARKLDVLVRNAGTPVAIVQDAAGHVVATLQVPTEAAIVGTVQKLRSGAP